MDKETSMKLTVAVKEEVQQLYNLTTLSDSELLDKIEEMIGKIVDESRHSDPSAYSKYASMTFIDKNGIKDSVFESVRGLDILGTIIADKSITEVMINGYDNIFVEQAGKLRRLEAQFENTERLVDIITKFVRQAGRSVDESNPIVDTRLADGSRVNVVMPPVALNGPIVTIRRFPEEAMTVHKLIQYGSLTEEAAEFLEKLVRAKFNIFVCGGTGCGKTTFLNALSNYIPSYERVITIEDSAELQIKSIPNLVRLETKNANSAGVGAITIRDLIKSSLRMRPERIIVGEVRGGEALDMLQAMNTGHDGSLSTGHANSTNDMLSRLETMVLSGSPGLPLEAIRQQIASAVDIIVHLSRMRDFSRKTMEITEVTGYENGKINLNPLYRFEESPDSTLTKVRGVLKRTENHMVHPDKFINAGIYDYLKNP
ncbi:MAG: CpaF family protein [Huintestinicola sp.]|uniref:CpaF family protein n=1 Tax=Huintestinicola sp. TaxID=2981661 RepID=UPI003F1261F7